MSDNYSLYQQKIREQRAAGAAVSQPLRDHLDELFEVVRWCERIWSIEDRIDRSPN